MIFPGFPGVPSFFQVFQVFQVEWEPCYLINIVRILRVVVHKSDHLKSARIVRPWLHLNFCNGSDWQEVTLTSGFHVCKESRSLPLQKTHGKAVLAIGPWTKSIHQLRLCITCAKQTHKPPSIEALPYFSKLPQFLSCRMALVPNVTCTLKAQLPANYGEYDRCFGFLKRTPNPSKNSGPHLPNSHWWHKLLLTSEQCFNAISLWNCLST